MSERPVPLFVPPLGHRSQPPAAIPVPPVPVTYPEPSLALGMATLTTDGRVREKNLIERDLGWGPGDRTTARLVADGIAIRRTEDGEAQIDSRGQILVPAASRAMRGITVGCRVVLVAIPERGVLVVHSADLVAALLVKHYRDDGVLDGL